MPPSTEEPATAATVAPAPSTEEPLLVADANRLFPLPHRGALGAPRNRCLRGSRSPQAHTAWG
eukprot:6453561-Alexandrium_andersonii.AAC.1